MLALLRDLENEMRVRAGVLDRIYPHTSSYNNLVHTDPRRLQLRAVPGTEESKVTVKTIKEAFHHLDRCARQIQSLYCLQRS
jgi:hypothetical protein